MSDNNALGPSIPFSPLRLAPLAILVIGLVASYSTGLHDYLSFDALKDNRTALMDWRSQHVFQAALAFIAIYSLAIAVSLPGALWMTIAAGFLFGTPQGALYVVIAATGGATIVFLAARYALADYFRAKAGEAVRKMETGFNKNAISYLLFCRLVPVFPFWLVNLVPALLNMRLRSYVIATFFGIIPGTFVYSSIGNGLGMIIDRGEMPDIGIVADPRILGPLIGLAILALIPIGYKKFKALSIQGE